METSDCIVDGLYLGGILAALNEKDLNNKGITHILSIDENPLPPMLAQRFNCKHVSALDMYDTDLLSSFADTFLFIEQAKNAGGNILVHCQAGMSRSATVVAAYLMQKMAIVKDKALELIKSSRPFAQPNDGFMKQLELFEKMGCQLIKTNKQYRSYKLGLLVDQFQQGQFSTDCEIPSDLLIQSDFASESNDAYYKCRKCRMILFRHGAVTDHVPGIGESAFDWRGKGPSKHNLSNVRDETEACSRSLFVDPLQWMKGKINTVSGKLHCPKCDIKLGSFIWYGEKCPCGAWVAPAFHIDAGKVDKLPFQTVAPRAHISSGATASAASAPQAVARPLSSFNDLAQRRPLSQGPGGFAEGHGLPGHLGGAHASSGGKPVAMVAAVTPRVAPTGSTPTSRMEIDELSVAVGTSSLESSVSPELRGDIPDSNNSMDVDS